MRQIADLHIHSRFSRACSKDLTLKNIDKTCRTKGVDIIATGDFTFPIWHKELKDGLFEVGKSGLFKLKNAEDDKIKFILSAEVALIYKKNDKCRRIHLVLHAPNFEASGELNDFLDKRYNIRSDGRPILGLSIEEFCKICFSIHPDFLIYPAHIWTPWFSIFGSKSGFNSWDEAFGEYAGRIYAYETGLSSDPEMNWRLSGLDNFTLLSNSDAHSLPNIAREANVFDLAEISYAELARVIKKEKGGSRLEFTIEFYPEEGMYHFDGHRACGAGLKPSETKKQKGLCPVCKKPLVIGVLNRVEELADRPSGFRPEGAPGFVKLVELDKIIAEALGVKSRNSKKVRKEYENIINKLGTELHILLDASMEEIREGIDSRIAEGIKRVREGSLTVKPGFDGQYGEINIFGSSEKKQAILSLI